MTKHTQGRLVASGDSERSFVATERGILIADFGAGARANADHAAACWNACISINPEAVPEMVKALTTIAEAKREDGRYDKHDAAGFIVIAAAALAKARDTH